MTLVHDKPSKHSRRNAILVILAAVLPAAGCMSPTIRRYPASPGTQPLVEVPRELNMVSFPEYTVAPPDILLIDALRIVPKGPVKLQPLDVVQVLIAGLGPTEEAGGVMQIMPEGTVALGPGYGTVRIAGQTLDEAGNTIREHLRSSIGLENVNATVSIVETITGEPIQADHIVYPDGTISLGSYGSVFVAGMTLPEVKKAVEAHLSQYLDNPIVAVDVLAYNSRVFYVIRAGGSASTGNDQIFRLPATGNERVLDALAMVQGLTSQQSKRIWVARPAPDGIGCEQILPVDYKALLAGGSTATNYQLFPGDRLYIAEDRFRAFDNLIEKTVAPFERILGFGLLGVQTIQTMNRFPDGTLQ